MSYGYYDYDNYEKRRYLGNLARENYQHGWRNEPCAFAPAEIQATLSWIESIQAYSPHTIGREDRENMEHMSRINDNLLNPIFPPRKKNDIW